MIFVLSTARKKYLKAALNRTKRKNLVAPVVGIECIELIKNNSLPAFGLLLPEKVISPCLNQRCGGE